jgi:SOS-response transcriptional repressor LexA
MNKAKIFEGDYVMLQMPRLAVSKRPENGAIVAVVLPDHEHITLKRFRRLSESHIVFEPESTNPDHIRYEHKPRGEYDIGYRVIGTVVAVLTPIS